MPGVRVFSITGTVVFPFVHLELMSFASGLSGEIGWSSEPQPRGSGKMRRIRPRLSYANVVATLALFLALGGGAVWAANKITSKQIGKGAVKTKNLGKGAVKTKNLGKGAVKTKSLAGKAVTSAKLADGAVTSAKIGDGAVSFAKLAAGTNVVGTATAGPFPPGPEAFVDVPLNPALTVTPVAGQLIFVSIEVRATLVAAEPEKKSCVVSLLPFLNGVYIAAGESLFLVAPAAKPPSDPTAPDGVSRSAATLPVGITEPGKPQSFTLKMRRSGACTPTSTIDQVGVVATQLK
jgi:hypothetical protein